MIKSRIITLLVSCVLTVSVGAGGYFITKIQKPQTEITENNEEVNNIDKENKDKNTDKDTSTIGEVENNKDESESSDNDGSETNSPNKVENNVSENVDLNLNNQINNKGNQFEDNKIEENIFENSNINTNNSIGNESVESPTIDETPNKEESSDTYLAEVEQAIFQRVNKERATNGLSSLTYNGTMEYYAKYKSKDMGDKGYFDHNDLNGELITAKMKRDGVSYNAWGENIAYIQGSFDNEYLAKKFMDNWMNSSGHRANILSSNFSSIGIGVYKVGDTYYATQEFYR